MSVGKVFVPSFQDDVYIYKIKLSLYETRIYDLDSFILTSKFVKHPMIC